MTSTLLARRPPDSVASHARAAATSNYRRDIILSPERGLFCALEDEAGEELFLSRRGIELAEQLLNLALIVIDHRGFAP
jgi:hypothetical protein